MEGLFLAGPKKFLTVEMMSNLNMKDLKIPGMASLAAKSKGVNHLGLAMISPLTNVQNIQNPLLQMLALKNEVSKVCWINQ